MTLLTYTDGNIWYAGSINKHFLNIIDSGTNTILTSGGTVAKFATSGSAISLNLNGPCNLVGCWISGLQGNSEQYNINLTVKDNVGTAIFSGLVFPNNEFVRYVGLGNRYVAAGGSVIFLFFKQGAGNAGSGIVIVDYI